MSLVVQLEVWPEGDEAKRSSIGHILIENRSTKVTEVADYDVRCTLNGKVTRARVRGHLRDKGALALLQRALEALEGAPHPGVR